MPIRRWRMLVASLIGLGSLGSTHFGYALWRSKYPDSALFPWMLSLTLLFLALVFAQEDGFRVPQERAATPIEGDEP